MRREAEQHRQAHRDEKGARCEAQASRYAMLRHEYERTANRFWEPVPVEAPGRPSYVDGVSRLPGSPCELGFRIRGRGRGVARVRPTHVPAVFDNRRR